MSKELEHTLSEASAVKNDNSQPNTLSRAERLRGEKRIARVFGEGKSFFVYPLRCVYRIERLPDDQTLEAVSILVSVPKRFHKRANKRNLLKRRIREAYRTQKHLLRQTAQQNNICIRVAFIYNSKDVLNYKYINDVLAKVLDRIREEI